MNIFKKIKNFFTTSDAQSDKKTIVSGYKNNKQRMLFTIEALIEKMDSINDGHIKCKDTLLKPIKNTIDNCTYAFEDVKDSEFEQEAYKIIYDFSFELLCSGRFHIYRGVLNEMNESTHLMHVCKSCLEWACEHKVITESEKKEQLEILRDEIRSVG
ncbi:MAG: hypothetical protein ACI4G0_03765 [Ruminococcus sp.]